MCRGKKFLKHSGRFVCSQSQSVSSFQDVKVRFSDVCFFGVRSFYRLACNVPRLYAVRDCELLTCPPTRNFMRGSMLELPLKPLLHIAFVSVSLFIFLVKFLSFLLHLFCLSCDWVVKLFCRFWS